MKQKGLNDVIKIGKFEITFYDNKAQLEYNSCVGDLSRCSSNEDITSAISYFEEEKYKLDSPSDVIKELEVQKDKIVAELCKMQMSNKTFIFRIYYNFQK